MAIKADIHVDTRAFFKSLGKTMGSNYPRAVAKGFQKLAMEGRDAARNRARSAFKLHSDFIPRGILSVPFTNAQVKKGERTMKKYHDIFAMVFVRSATDPKKSLGFLSLHEYGGKKKSEDGPGMLAIPASDIQNYRYRTGRGKTAKRWQPSELLKEFNEKGPNKKGSKIHGRKKGRKKPTPYLMEVKGGVTMVARRKTGARKPNEFLYALKRTAAIKKTFHMEHAVDFVVRNQYRTILERALQMGLYIGPEK